MRRTFGPEPSLSNQRSIGSGKAYLVTEVRRTLDYPLFLSGYGLLKSNFSGVFYMPTNWKDYVVSTSDILHGKPRIKETRIPVSLILGYLSARYSFEQIIHEFPDLTEEHIAACLDYARDLA